MTHHFLSDATDRAPGAGIAPDGARLIPLTKGYFAIVDEADFDLVGNVKWCVQVKGDGLCAYAVRHVRGARLMMHRVIIGAKPGELVDHWNGNGLDNRRSNLSICTPSQNVRKGRHRANATGFRGVQWNGSGFQAKIHFEGKRRHVGFFPSAVEAALAYDRAAKHWFGEYCTLNFPDKSAPVLHQLTLSDGDTRCLYPKRTDR